MAHPLMLKPPGASACSGCSASAALLPKSATARSRRLSDPGTVTTTVRLPVPDCMQHQNVLLRGLTAEERHRSVLEAVGGGDFFVLLLLPTLTACRSNRLFGPDSRKGSACRSRRVHAPAAASHGSTAFQEMTSLFDPFFARGLSKPRTWFGLW